MKKLTFTILLFVCAIGANARTKTYTNNNANLSFTYSDEFNSVQIQNAPHMLLELEKGDIILALSCWHYGLGYSYTAWNNDFVTMTKEKYTNNPYLSLVAIDKKYFVSPNGNKKYLVSIANSKQGHRHIVAYQIIHKGNLVQIVITNAGKYTIDKIAQYNEYIKGLDLK